MSSKNIKIKSSLRALRLPILLSSAIAIVAVCSSLYAWYEEITEYKQATFTQTYNQGLADSTAAFLGQLIEEDNIEAVSDIAHRLAEQDNIQQVAVYQRTGELIHTEGEEGAPHSDPVIANISFENSYNGYLIIYFAPTSLLMADKEQPWFHGSAIWFIGGLVWLIFFIALNIRGWLASKPKTEAKHSGDVVISEQDNAKLLKQLMKRNLKESKDAEFKSSLVIKASWSKLDNGNNSKLLKILSRWLPQNGLLATQFNRDLLVLGLDKNAEALTRNPLYALEQSLKALQLEPKIIVHDLEFGQDIYQTFFNIIEPGIWFEKTLHNSDPDKNWPAYSTINIELEENKIIELCRLPQPDAQQVSLIERQVRFISDD